MIGVYIVTKNMTVEQHTKGAPGCAKQVRPKTP
jgi:hypothetical protein